MNFFELDEDNFLMFAIKHYDNPDCKSFDDFEEDLNICVYIKRLLRKYKKTGELKERLILNHIITFYNVFGVFAATKILFYKIETDLHSILKSFLFYLGYVPDKKSNLIDKNYSFSINIDEIVIKKLREL
jgi:hypothetical protein